MLARLQCTGPAHIFIKPGLGFSPGSGVQRGPARYLGTCTETPRIAIRRKFRGVQNDIAGDVPMDLSYQGQEALCMFDLSRWDEDTYINIASFPHSPGGAGTPFATRGIDLEGDVGALMVQEGRMHEVYVQFPYGVGGAQAKTAMSVQPVPPGYHFLAGMPIDPDDLTQMGTRPRRLGLTYYCIRTYDPATLRQRLYDADMSGLPSPN